MKISDEMYKIKDLELKSDIAKSLRDIRDILKQINEKETNEALKMLQEDK